MKFSFPWMTFFGVAAFVLLMKLRTCNKQEEVRPYYDYTPSYSYPYGDYPYYKGPLETPPTFTRYKSPFEDDIRELARSGYTREQFDSSMRSAIRESMKDSYKIELDSAGKALYDSLTRIKMAELDSLNKKKH